MMIMLKKMKGKPQAGQKHLKNMSDKGLYLAYRKNSYNPNNKKTTHLK